MNNIFEILFESTKCNETKSHYEQRIIRNIEKNEVFLKKHLSKNEKKLLLRIIDNKDLLLGETAVHNFTEGFKLGVKLGLELHK